MASRNREQSWSTLDALNRGEEFKPDLGFRNVPLNPDPGAVAFIKGS